MLTIHDLPSLVVRRIFVVLYNDCAAIRYSDQYEPDLIREFTPIAAVCRRWREYAIPQLCSTIVCEYYPRLAGLEDDKCTDTSALNHGLWKTNVNIIISNNASVHTKEFRIKPANPQSVFNKTYANSGFGLMDVLEKSKFGSVSWTNITNLSCIQDVFPSDLKLDSAVESIHGNMCAFPEYFEFNVPNIRRIITDGAIYTDVEDTIINTLIKHYNGQLECLFANQLGTDLISSLTLDNITHLKITDDDFALYKFLHSHASQLQFLSISSRFPYIEESPSIEPQKIMFENLKTLCINHLAEDTNTQINNLGLISVLEASCFPKVTSLSIQNYPLDISQLLSHFALEMLNTLEIYGDTIGIKRTSLARFSSLKSMTIYSSKSSHSPDYNIFVNQIFNTPLPIETIDIYRPFDLFEFSKTSALAQLRSLSICEVLSVRLLGYLISHLPKLNTLAFTYSNRCWIDRDYAGICSSPNYEFKDQHISTSIESIRFNTIAIDDVALDNLVLFATQIPSLLRISVDSSLLYKFKKHIHLKYTCDVSRPSLCSIKDTLYRNQFGNPEYL